MISDITSVPAGSVIEADIGIIGGGPAAIAFALRLSGDRRKVVILESGGFKLQQASRLLTEGEQSGIPYFDLKETRYRLLGGSTYRWGARTAPLKAIDFARRDWIEASGWPVSRTELDPYYDQAFDLIGLHKPFNYDDDVWHYLNGSRPAFDSALLEYSAFQFGKNLLFGEVYRDRLRSAANVVVFLEASALSIQAGGQANHVEGIDIGHVDGGRWTLKAKRYVLAAGGIENARLLLLSSGANPAGLCNGNDMVGRCFMEHPTVSAGSIESNDRQFLQDTCSPGLVGGRLVEVGLALAPDVQRKERCLNAVARVKVVVTRDATQALRELVWNAQHRQLPHELDWYQKNRWLTERLLAVVSDPFSIVANLTRHALGKPKRFKVDSVYLELRTEQEPNRESRVTLSDAIDAFGQRKAHLHWALTPRDKRTMRVTAELFGAELARLQLGRLHIERWLASDEPVFPSGMVGGHHHMGTTRMSVDARQGVVDANCRAHEVDNLYVAGTSVFSTSGYVNPTSTLLALSLRLADHLKSLPS